MTPFQKNYTRIPLSPSQQPIAVKEMLPPTEGKQDNIHYKLLHVQYQKMMQYIIDVNFNKGSCTSLEAYFYF